MTQVTGHLQHGPLTRRVILSGPADDFQRSELARLHGSDSGGERRELVGQAGGLPLIVEGSGGFAPGLPFRAVARLSGRASPSLQRSMELVR